MDVKINILNRDVQIPEEMVQAADGDELIARIFYNRGYKDPDTIRQMLQEDLYVPTLCQEFPGMSKAIARILKAIQEKEMIAVYGDYDVDGVTSTVTLVQCLKMFTDRVLYHVPDRFTEGYGMNEGVINSLAWQGVSLIITCDCGISNINEIKAAKSLGLDVVVTDHHNIPEELPPADVILNPKFLPEGHKARNLPGCGMAYFVCSALLEHSGQAEKNEVFLDMLALSLVADVVSLNGENRYLLKKALPKLFGTVRTGLKELFSIIERKSKLKNEEDIAFQIAPRINAAGRMESARLPVELFLCNDSTQALSMAQKIDILNTDRKRLQQEILKEALEEVESKKKNKTILVLFNEFWHHGILGIAAGKVCETYRKPVILLSLKEDGCTVVGSARSVDDVNIYDLIHCVGSKLLKFGGHSMAAGLSLRREDVDSFIQEIERVAEERYYIKSTIRADVDMELSLEQIDEGLYVRLENAGPYGEGFSQPVFTSHVVTVVSDRVTERKHHIMVLADEKDTRISAVKWFGMDGPLTGKVCDITYKVGKNSYKGNSELQLTMDYVVETEGKPQIAYKGKIIDGRNMDIKSILQQFEGAVVFYEGLTSLCPIDHTINRFCLRSTENLVFLSTPVNTAIFREIVSWTNPKNLILNFSVLPDYTWKGFMINLMGNLKHIIHHEEGRFDIEQLAVKMCIEETLLKAALKYLKVTGKLEYSVNTEENTACVWPGGHKEDRSIHRVEKNLKDALMEKNAYRQFILELNINQFFEYFK